MNTPNASSLFHFTNKIDVLKSIIRNGFRFSYSYEVHDFSSFDSDERPDFKGLAIPIICFCNTPIARAENHAKVYGKYFVGVNKEFMMELYGSILNPVIYYSSNNLIKSINDINRGYNNLRDLGLKNLNNFKEEIEPLLDDSNSKLPLKKKFEVLPPEIQDHFKVLNDLKFSADFILAMSKPIWGKNKIGEDVFLDEEREWRAIIMDNIDNEVRWEYYDSEEAFKEEKDELNKHLFDSDLAYITLPTAEWGNMISHICVENEDQIPEIANYILSCDRLFGAEINDDNKYVRSYLLTRITSFERLSNDI